MSGLALRLKVIAMENNKDNFSGNEAIGVVGASSIVKMATARIIEGLYEVPIEALMTANVRTGIHTPLDTLENYFNRQREDLKKYVSKPSFSKDFADRKNTEIERCEEALDMLRRSKVEAWLHCYPVIQQAEREFGLLGAITINFPLRYDNVNAANLDWVTGRAHVWIKK